MGNIICCVCGRKVGTTDFDKDIAAGLCDIHRAEARKREDAEDEELDRLQDECRKMHRARKATEPSGCALEVLAALSIIAAALAVLL